MLSHVHIIPCPCGIGAPSQNHDPLCAVPRILVQFVPGPLAEKDAFTFASLDAARPCIRSFSDRLPQVYVREGQRVQKPEVLALLGAIAQELLDHKRDQEAKARQVVLHARQDRLDEATRRPLLLALRTASPLPVVAFRSLAGGWGVPGWNRRMAPLLAEDF